jgi:hypothetical protein
MPSTGARSAPSASRRRRASVSVRARVAGRRSGRGSRRPTVRRPAAPTTRRHGDGRSSRAADGGGLCRARRAVPRRSTRMPLVSGSSHGGPVSWLRTAGSGTARRRRPAPSSSWWTRRGARAARRSTTRGWRGAGHGDGRPGRRRRGCRSRRSTCRATAARSPSRGGPALALRRVRRTRVPPSDTAAAAPRRAAELGDVAGRPVRRVHPRPQPVGARPHDEPGPALTTDGVEDFGYATNNAGWTRSPRRCSLWSPDSRRIARSSTTPRRRPHVPRHDQRRHAAAAAVALPAARGHRHLPHPPRRHRRRAGARRAAADAAGPHRSTIYDHIARRQPGGRGVVPRRLARRVRVDVAGREGGGVPRGGREHRRGPHGVDGDVADAVPVGFVAMSARELARAAGSNEVLWWSQRDDWGTSTCTTCAPAR